MRRIGGAAGASAPRSKLKSAPPRGRKLAEITVVGGRGGLAAAVAAALGSAHVKADVRTFPDGESKITLDAEPETGAPVAVVHSTSPPVDSNLVQALSMIREARRFTGEVTAAIPYMGYARQDKKFLGGEVVTMEVVAGLFEAAGATKVVVVDIHSREALSHFSVPAVNVSAVPELAAHFVGQGLADPLVVSPDLGGAHRAREFAKRIGAAECVVLEKKRDRHTGEVRIVGAGPGEAGGRDIVLVDDMISTGGSMVEAAGFLRERGCGRVFAVCTHALLMGGAAERMRRAGVSEIVGTNTVSGRPNGGCTIVNVAGSVAGSVAASHGEPGNN